jgi:hypothetical protein
MTREEAAEFWDTHDLSDYWDELEPGTIEQASMVQHVIEVEVSARDLGDLIALARQRGVEPLALAAQWLADRLASEHSGEPNTR